MKKFGELRNGSKFIILPCGGTAVFLFTKKGLVAVKDNTKDTHHFTADIIVVEVIV